MLAPELAEAAIARTELPAGARVGAYVVESVRARLPHVIIHRARHVVTGRTVAVQLLRPQPDAPSLRLIRRELAALNRLRHAHIAEILETGEVDDGRPYLVVEWVAGRSLQTALDERSPLTLDEALPIVDEIGAALTAAHALGVVHGELHARNVGLVARGELRSVKLVSFGMARLSGTRLAPEQRRGGGVVDKRADVFALGALVRQMVPELPLAVDEVVARALRAEPAQRWDSVDAFLTALRAAAAGSELVAELHVTAYLDPAVDDVDARALEDAERALVIAQQWLERQQIALVLGGAGAVVATARIPRALEQQRAARAGWVNLAAAVRRRMDARRAPHPAVRTRVQIRIDG